MPLYRQEDRFEILNEIAKYQLNILNNAEKIKSLEDNKENYQYIEENKQIESK